MKKWIVNELNIFTDVKKNTVFDTLEDANRYAKETAKENSLQKFEEGLYMYFEFADFVELIQIIEIEIKG